MRRKRPPALSFLLRLDDAAPARAHPHAAGARLRRRLRGHLHGADGQGGDRATALGVERVARGDQGHDRLRLPGDARCCSRAPGLYADRAQRPGLPRIVSSLFQVTVVALIFAVVNGEQYSSYYIFYGTLFFAIVYVSALRWVYEQITGVLLRAAGYRRRARARRLRQAHRGRRPRADDEAHAPVELVGFISLTPRPDNGLRSLGHYRGPRRGARPPPRAGGHHRRPGLPPAAARSSSSTAATSAA